MIEHEIRINEAGQRLDKFLGKYMPLAPKRFFYKMLRKKNITLNGKKAAGQEKLAEGDRIRFFLSDETVSKFTGSAQTTEKQERKRPAVPPVELDILYEDRHTLFINKPAGMLSQKAAADDVSLVEYVTGYLLKSGQITDDELRTFHPAVCNRLDRNTSGIVAAGKTLAALQELSAMFRDRTLRKYYLCFVAGSVKEGAHIDGYLVKDPKTNRVSFSKTETAGAVRIETEYRPLCEAVGGQFIKLGPSSSDCIGLMDIRRIKSSPYATRGSSTQRRESLLAEKVSWLSVWYSLQKRNLTEEDMNYIDASLIECYGRRGITFDNASLFETDGVTIKEMPVIQEWYDILREKTETKHLSVILTRYVTGSAASMGGHTNVDTDNPYIVIDLTDIPDDLQLATVYAATGFATDITVQNGDVGTALLSDELWKLLGANSNPLAADYTMRMVKLIRSQGGIAGVTSQGMADMMALDNGKYGKGILDSCRIKFIMQMEEQEAQLAQDILNLTEEETKMVTRFRRGEGLLCIGHNHVPIAVHVSPKEYEAITTSPTDLRARSAQSSE